MVTLSTTVMLSLSKHDMPFDKLRVTWPSTIWSLGYGCSVPNGDGVTLASGPGEPELIGVAVGSGALRRQIGKFKFGVGVGVGSVVGTTTMGLGLNLGGGIGVGSGSGGTRGSGNCGSSAALMTSVRFQFDPYGEALFSTGAGVTVMGAMLSSRFSVTCPMTLSPACSPNEIAVISTAMPSNSAMVMNRFDGSSTSNQLRLRASQRLRSNVARRRARLPVRGASDHM
jgi:hypothetical protein